MELVCSCRNSRYLKIFINKYKLLEYIIIIREVLYKRITSVV